MSFLPFPFIDTFFPVGKLLLGLSLRIFKLYYRRDSKRELKSFLLSP